MREYFLLPDYREGGISPMAIQAALEATGHQEEQIALVMSEKPADSGVGAFNPASAVIIDNFDEIGPVSEPVPPVFVLDLSGCITKAESERVALELINRYHYLPAPLRPYLLYDPKDSWRRDLDVREGQNGIVESALVLLNMHFTIVGIVYGSLEARLEQAAEHRRRRLSDPTIVT